MANDTLKKIGEVLLGAENVLLFPHTNADGDAAGSCQALALALESKGVKCRILMEDKLAANLQFLDSGLFTWDNDIFGKEFDIAIAVDSGEVSRFPKREEVFHRGRTAVCIDHHPTSKPFADYNYIDPEAAATGEIIFDLIGEMGVKVDEKIAQALFTAITTDCGNFQYSNTTKRTFEIAAALTDSGFSLSETSNAIYQNNPVERIKIETRILETMEMIAGGKVAMAYVTKDMLAETGALMEHTEGLINILRGIAGVEVAVFLKEGDEGKVKVSMRSKSYANVSELCSSHGGGGHVRASGCTLEMPMGEALSLMRKEVPGVL